MNSLVKAVCVFASLTFALAPVSSARAENRKPNCKPLSETPNLPELDTLGFCLYPDLEDQRHDRQRRKLELEHACDLTDFGLPKNQVRTEADQGNRDNCLKLRNIRSLEGGIQ